MFGTPKQRAEVASERAEREAQREEERRVRAIRQEEDARLAAIKAQEMAQARHATACHHRHVTTMQPPC